MFHKVDLVRRLCHHSSYLKIDLLQQKGEVFVGTQDEITYPEFDCIIFDKADDIVSNQQGNLGKNQIWITIQVLEKARDSLWLLCNCQQA